MVLAIVDYFCPLIRNITALVYNSPTMRNRVKIRAFKNQKGQHLAQQQRATPQVLDVDDVLRLQQDASNGQTTLDALITPQSYENALPPHKICCALLLQLFCKPFSLNDEYDMPLYIWYGNAWLDALDHNRLTANSKQKGQHQNCLITQKELGDAVGLIRESLKQYHEAPLWLQHMIFHSPEARKATGT